jgi:hypothetical protein
MKKVLARWLRQLAEWLDPTQPLVDPTLLAFTRALVEAAEVLPQTSSFKRAKVMSALIHRFPNRPRRELSFAIEWVLR